MRSRSPSNSSPSASAASLSALRARTQSRASSPRTSSSQARGSSDEATDLSDVEASSMVVDWQATSAAVTARGKREYFIEWTGGDLGEDCSAPIPRASRSAPFPRSP